MRVAVLPGDNGGCGNLRMRWPAEAVRAVRPDWEITVYQPRGDVQVGLDRNQKVVAVRIDPLPDVMVLQRTGSPVLAGVAEFMMERGVAVVADFDDAMWCIDRDNIAWPAWNMNRRMGPTRMHWSFCDHVAERVDLVTVTTDGLARRYGKHGRCEIIPNGVPKFAMESLSWRDRYDPTFTVGWAGYTGTHPGDCQVSEGAATAVVEAGGRARVVADAEGAARAWGVDVDDVPPQPPRDYYAALSCMDVMLVGLRDTPFNRCKSFLKVLEAAAVNVPSIAAATAPHRALWKTGFPVMLAESPAEWREAALWLMKEPLALADMRAALFDTMPAHMIENRAEEWARAWERARKRADSRG